METTTTLSPEDQVLARLLIIAKMGARLSSETIANLNKPTPLFTYNGTSIQHAAVERFELLVRDLPLDLTPTAEEIEALRAQLSGSAPATIPVPVPPNIPLEAWLQMAPAGIRSIAAVHTGGALGGTYAVIAADNSGAIRDKLTEGVSAEEMREMAAGYLQGRGPSIPDAMADLVKKLYPMPAGAPS